MGITYSESDHIFARITYSKIIKYATRLVASEKLALEYIV